MFDLLLTYWPILLLLYVPRLVPFLVPYFFVSLAVQKLEGPGVDLTTRFTRLRERGAKAIAAGSAQIDALQARWTEHPPLIYRIWRLARFGYSPC